MCCATAYDSSWSENNNNNNKKGGEYFQNHRNENRFSFFGNLNFISHAKENSHHLKDWNRTEWKCKLLSNQWLECPQNRNLKQIGILKLKPLVYRFLLLVTEVLTIQRKSKTLEKDISPIAKALIKTSSKCKIVRGS